MVLGTATFDCGTEAEAQTLGAAYNTWGAVTVTVEGRRVEVSAPQSLIMASMRLFQTNLIDDMHAGRITAEDLASTLPGNTETERG